jgi:hypothetical protein
MGNPTTNFGWQMPTATDLVTDLPADFEVFGQAVDTDFVDLLGGTTGQVLSKTSATDMAFTWIDSDDANAIQNAIVDAKGDLIGATAADTPSRLAVGTNGQVLTADSAEATGLKWATPSSGSAMTLVTSGSFSSSSEFNVGTAFSATYLNYKIVLDITARSGNLDLNAKMNDDSDHAGRRVIYTDTTTIQQNTSLWKVMVMDGSIGALDMMIYAPYASEYTKITGLGTASDVSSLFTGVKTSSASFTSITFQTSTGNVTGTYRVYGLANS